MMPTMIIMVIPAVIGIPGKFVEDAGVIHILAAKLLRGVLWVEYRNVFTSRWVMVTRRNRFIPIPRLTDHPRGGVVVRPIKVVRIAAPPVVRKHKTGRGLPVMLLLRMNMSMKNN
jgi:hypothetical protein